MKEKFIIIKKAKIFIALMVMLVAIAGVTSFAATKGRTEEVC